MNNFTEDNWTLFTFNQAITDVMKTYIKHPPRELQSETCSGPVTLTRYQRFQWILDSLKNGNTSLPLPAGNYHP
jgi:arylsulfatase